MLVSQTGKRPSVDPRQKEFHTNLERSPLTKVVNDGGFIVAELCAAGCIQ